jgi:hypothetical protein
MQLFIEDGPFEGLSPIINPRVRQVTKISSILASRSLKGQSLFEQQRSVQRPSKYNSDLDLLFSGEEQPVSRNTISRTVH